MPTSRRRPVPGVRPAPARPSTPPPRTGRLWRRVILALLVGFGLLAAERTGALRQVTDRIFPPKVNWMNDYAMVQRLRTVVTDEGLTRDRKDCLLFIINGNDPPTATRLRVLEKHTGTCGGDPKALPELFTMRVDRTNGHVETDAGSRGDFRPIR